MLTEAELAAIRFRYPHERRLWGYIDALTAALAAERVRVAALVASGDVMEATIDALQLVHDDDHNGIEAAWQDIFAAFAGWRAVTADWRAARGEGGDGD